MAEIRYTDAVQTLASGFALGMTHPMDGRLIALNYNQLTDVTGNSIWTIAGDNVAIYRGLMVYVVDEKATYQFIGDYKTGTDTITKETVSNKNNWVKVIDSRMPSTVKFDKLKPGLVTPMFTSESDEGFGNVDNTFLRANNTWGRIKEVSQTNDGLVPQIPKDSSQMYLIMASASPNNNGTSQWRTVDDFVGTYVTSRCLPLSGGTVSGKTTFEQGLKVSGLTSVSGLVTNYVIVDNSLAVSGGTRIKGNLGVGGSFTLSGQVLPNGEEAYFDKTRTGFIHPMFSSESDTGYDDVTNTYLRADNSWGRIEVATDNKSGIVPNVPGGSDMYILATTHINDVKQATWYSANQVIWGLNLSGNYLPLSGGTINGNLTVSGNTTLSAMTAYTLSLYDISCGRELSFRDGTGSTLAITDGINISGTSNFYGEVKLGRTLTVSGKTTHKGKVLIEADGNEALCVSGNVCANAFYEHSDETLKENINVIDKDAINKIGDISLKQFEFKSDTSHTTKYGVIAQEVEQCGLSNLVHTDSNGVKSVDYISMLCAMIEKLKQDYNELSERLARLENKE